MCYTYRQGGTAVNYRISYIVYLPGIFLSMALIFARMCSGHTWIAIAGAVLFFLNELQLLLFYRCPKCGAPLSLRKGPSVYCPKCGCRLDSELKKLK